MLVMLVEGTAVLDENIKRKAHVTNLTDSRSFSGLLRNFLHHRDGSCDQSKGFSCSGKQSKGAQMV